MPMPSRLDDWLERIQQRHPVSIELGLERCGEVWERMGRVRPAGRNIIVAGTNGKGSTVAGIEAALAFLGLRVGSYTSPHLIRYNERVRIEGRDASDQAIISGFESVEAALGGTRLTYFEFGTLAAFATLAAEQLDFSVLEIGLGGRLDAVNLIDAEVAVLTPIGIDHSEYLGSDRESIGREKAGVMRRGQAVVLSDRDPPDSVLSTASELDARLIRIGVDFDVSRAMDGTWRYFFADQEVLLPVVMLGAHQADNLGTALTAVIQADPGATSRLGEIARAAAGIEVRGRLERVCGSPEVIVDVGHNPLAAITLARFLDGRAGSQCRVVLAMLGDKDAEGFVTSLGGRVSTWYCAGLTGPRGQTASALASRVRSALPGSTVVTCESVTQALDTAMADSSGAGLVLVCGSFYTAAEAIMHLEGHS